jgi:hypothetical protein
MFYHQYNTRKEVKYLTKIICVWQQPMLQFTKCTFFSVAQGLRASGCSVSPPINHSGPPPPPPIKLNKPSNASWVCSYSLLLVSCFFHKQKYGQVFECLSFKFKIMLEKKNESRMIVLSQVDRPPLWERRSGMGAK